MKKISYVIISLLVILALTACSSQNAQIGSENNSTAQSESVPVESEQATDENTNAASDSKTLVVYFSATGNTKQAAQYIASATGGELFALEPVKPYSDADLRYTDENSRVVFEHDNPGERKVALVASTVDNFADYDTVFIGYPIWWGIAAWPVNGFVEANDFTGKTVIPFCTSASSGFGESGELLKEAAKTGNWLEGIRFSSSVSQQEVADWVDSLSY